MEVRIGIKENGRDLTFESDQDAKSLSALVEEALGSSVLKVTDNRGKLIMVPSASIAYVEIGAEEGRRVGFIA